MNVEGYERREVAAARRGSVLKSGLTQTDFALHLGTSIDTPDMAQVTAGRKAGSGNRAQPALGVEARG